MKSLKNITGIILAGGKSTRMGTNKGFVTIDNKTFMQYIIESLTPLVDEVIIVSDYKPYDQFNLKRVADMVKNSGPIAGVYTGLCHSKTQDNIILSCDVPFVNKALLSILIRENTYDFDIIQLQSGGKNMPLIALYKKRCEAQFLSLLQAGEKRLNTAIRSLNTKTIVIPKAFEKFSKNINTKEELKHELKN